MKSLKARQEERAERRDIEGRIAARSALANRKGGGGELYPAEFDPNETDNEEREEGGGEGGGGDGATPKKGGKAGGAAWTPNA